jgi:hypothetical protein
MKRTELVLYLINSFDRLGLPRPEIIQSAGLRLFKSKNKQEILDFDPAKKEEMSKSTQQLF